MIGQLMWKEWREHRWKMAALLAVVFVPMLGILCWNVGREGWDRYRVRDFWNVLMAGCWLVPIWIGAWTATGERTRETQGMLAGLPVRRWAVFGVKSLWGLATVLLPLAAGMACVEAMAGAKGNLEMWPVLMTAASLYLMIAAITAEIRKEGFAAMVGLLVVLGSGIWMGLATLMAMVWLQDMGTWVMAPNPFLVYWAGALEPRGAGIAWATQGVMGLVWWAIGAWRYGKRGQAGRGGMRVREAGRAGGAIGPGRFWLGAMIWREWREQRWVVFGAAMAAVGVALLASLVTNYRVGGYDWGRAVLRDLAGFLAFMAMLVPTVVGVVLGVGSLSEDMEPRVMGFWRSRPMKVGAFFWSKYAVAMSGIWVLFAVLVATALAGDYVSDLGRTNVVSTRFYFVAELLTVMAGWLPLVLTVTMLLYVLIRRAIYVVVLAVVVLAAIYWGAAWCLEPYSRGQVTLEKQLEMLRVVAGMGIVLTAALAVLARVALGRDWGMRG